MHGCMTCGTDNNNRAAHTWMASNRDWTKLCCLRRAHIPSAVDSSSCMATAVGGQNKQQGFPALPASRTSAGSCFSHLHRHSKP